MNKDKQNIVIAEFCGWTLGAGMHGLPWWTDPDGCHNEPPDYTSDLNAIHEAEKKLSPRQCAKYFGFLATSPYERTVAPEAAAWQAHANPAIRSEAFVRTIEKWEDEK